MHTEPKSAEKEPDGPLTSVIPVTDLPAHGRDVSIKARPKERTGIAETCDLAAVDDFSAEFHIAKSTGDLLVVSGKIQADVTQTCSVTLEPVHNRVEADISQVFTLNPAFDEEEVDITVDDVDPPEPVIDGVIDFGAFAMEHLILNLDPYPRSGNARFDQEIWGKDDDDEDSQASNPFAALAALKNPENGPKNES